MLANPGTLRQPPPAPPATDSARCEARLQPVAKGLDFLGADLVRHRIAVPFHPEPQLPEHLQAVLGDLYRDHRVTAAVGHEYRLRGGACCQLRGGGIHFRQVGGQRDQPGQRWTG